MSTIWGTHDQALAWAIWRDEESVTRVGPGGDIGFRALARIRVFYPPQVSRPPRVSRRPPEKPPGRGWPKIPMATASLPTNEAIVTVTPEGHARIVTSTPRLGSPAEFYEACARGEVIVWGRFNDGEPKPIPTWGVGLGPSAEAVGLADGRHDRVAAGVSSQRPGRSLWAGARPRRHVRRHGLCGGVIRTPSRTGGH